MGHGSVAWPSTDCMVGAEFFESYVPVHVLSQQAILSQMAHMDPKLNRTPNNLRKPDFSSFGFCVFLFWPKHVFNEFGHGGWLSWFWFTREYVYFHSNSLSPIDGAITSHTLILGNSICSTKLDI